MWEGRSILVVVPARGCSKGIPLKNISPVAGKPLIAHTAALVRRLDWVDRAVVSTDSLVIRDAAVEHGLDAPFMRPPDLSGDRIGDLEVLVHALQAAEAHDGRQYDVVIMLQPTSPLRRPEHVTECVRRLVTDDLDAVWTVSPTDLKAHPLKQLTVDANGRLGYWDDRGRNIIARQQLTPVYHRNGAAYALTRSCLLEKSSITGDRTGAVVIEEPMVSIDTEEDIVKVETALAARKADEEPAELPPVKSRLRTIVVDIDGVLAEPVPDLDYARAGPLAENIARVNALNEAGCRIVLFTARGSGTGKDWTEVTRNQLDQWGVRYHELLFGKPAADYYIDDRLLTLSQALSLCGLDDPALHNPAKP